MTEVAKGYPQSVELHPEAARLFHRVKEVHERHLTGGEEIPASDFLVLVLDYYVKGETEEIERGQPPEPPTIGGDP